MPHAEDSADEPMNEIVNTHSSSTKTWETATTRRATDRQPAHVVSSAWSLKAEWSEARWGIKPSEWWSVSLWSLTARGVWREKSRQQKKNLWIIIIQPERYAEVAIFWKVCSRSNVIRGNKRNVPEWPVKYVWEWSARLQWTYCTRI